MPPRHTPAPLPPPHHPPVPPPGSHSIFKHILNNYSIFLVIKAFFTDISNVATAPSAMKSGKGSGGVLIEGTVSSNASVLATGGSTVSAGSGGTRVPHLPDLTHLPGPLTEDAVIKCLQAKFYANKFYVSIIPTIPTLP